MLVNGIVFKMHSKKQIRNTSYKEDTIFLEVSVMLHLAISLFIVWKETIYFQYLKDTECLTDYRHGLLFLT